MTGVHAINIAIIKLRHWRQNLPSLQVRIHINILFVALKRIATIVTLAKYLYMATVTKFKVVHFHFLQNLQIS